jgi:DNA-binding transcriptional ArsR family regulator
VPRAATSSDPYNAIAEPRRREILDYLKGEERSVGEIAAALGLGQPSASKHLQVLRQVDLVRDRREGKRVLYRTNANTLKTIHDWTSTFQQHWSAQLTRIKRHAENKKG